MTEHKEGSIRKEEICNLSRVPFSITENPCYMTALQCIESDIHFSETILYQHYKNFKCDTLADFYQIENPVLQKYSYKSSFLPWIHTSPVLQYKDVAFIKRDDEFILKQVGRIKKLIKSCQEYGYKPELFPDRKKGYITGYYLESASSKKFYVVSGNHRVGVLCALFPEDDIPIIYEDKSFSKPRDWVNRGSPYLSVYGYKNVENWPAVSNGFVSAELAIKIMEKYTDA